MKNLLFLSNLLIVLLTISCNTTPRKNTNTSQNESLAPKEKLKEAYQLFKEGKDEESVALAEEVLKIGKEKQNDTLIGRALTSLCRNAQRELDTTRLAVLSDQLKELAVSSGNEKWLMYRAHQNAEMWRLVGNMDRAETFYDESMRISKATNSEGMYMIDHFNKSFVSTAKGNFEEANNLIKKYYALRLESKEKNDKKQESNKAIEPTDPYGLIAIAYFLEQQKKYEAAHEVATVTRRLFAEQNIFPEPPDEKPLLAVEAKVKKELAAITLTNISEQSASQTVASLLKKHIR